MKLHNIMCFWEELATSSKHLTLLVGCLSLQNIPLSLKKISNYIESAMPIDQVSSLFSAPFTTDISIVKMDFQGRFTQVKNLPNLK